MQELREKSAQTLALMVTSDVFLNPKYTGKAKETLPSVMQYLGTKLGMTKQDLAVLSPKLVAQINQSMGGSSEASSRKRGTPPSNAEVNNGQGDTPPGAGADDGGERGKKKTRKTNATAEPKRKRKSSKGAEE